ELRDTEGMAGGDSEHQWRVTSVSVDRGVDVDATVEMLLEQLQELILAADLRVGATRLRLLRIESGSGEHPTVAYQIQHLSWRGVVALPERQGPILGVRRRLAVLRHLLIWLGERDAGPHAAFPAGAAAIHPAALAPFGAGVSRDGDAAVPFDRDRIKLAQKTRDLPPVDLAATKEVWRCIETGKGSPRLQDLPVKSL